ncbi:J domain-containing protein [Candidatus Woesearchaeota archaeon]|nr:J domain-containing protein [Candidatus Woesearchaeota archaeon]
MPRIKVKGAEFNFNPVRDSYNRRSQQFKNDIISTLRKINLTDDDVEIKLEANCRINAPGVAEWYYEGFRLYFSCKLYDKYAENLYVVSKVIEFYVNAFVNKEISLDDFTRKFSEEDDIEKQRKEARKLLGVSEDCLDMDEISRKYKVLAKQFHPDMPEGNLETFKKINNAHKMLKRELE